MKNNFVKSLIIFLFLNIVITFFNIWENCHTDL